MPVLNELFFTYNVLESPTEPKAVAASATFL